MTTIKYDGTFQGLLSVIYDIYYLKIRDPQIVSRFRNNEVIMFGDCIYCDCDFAKAKKVHSKINSLTANNEINFLYTCFLSENIEIEQLIYQYCKNLIATDGKSSKDYGLDCTLKLRTILKNVTRESHRMKAFVRFQEIEEGLYFANCTPDFDVLPLISKHFTNRYQDQKWIIYDLSRVYGIYYNLKSCQTINIAFDNAALLNGLNNSTNRSTLVTDKEVGYSNLWKTYFDKVDIQSRRNMKLHIQHVPKRYWKFLNEKVGQY
jgi:probable DNA metabolism protein